MTNEEKREIQARLFAALAEGDADSAGRALHELTRVGSPSELDLLLDLLAQDSFEDLPDDPLVALAAAVPAASESLLDAARQLHDEARAVAAAFFQRALAADPDSVDLHLELAGHLTSVVGDHDAAEASLRRALELAPDHPNVLGDLARFTARVRRDRPAADALFRRAVEVDPTTRRTSAASRPSSPARGTPTTRPRRCSAAPSRPTPTTRARSATSPGS